MADTEQEDDGLVGIPALPPPVECEVCARIVNHPGDTPLGGWMAVLVRHWITTPPATGEVRMPPWRGALPVEVIVCSLGCMQRWAHTYDYTGPRPEGLW